MSQLSQFNKLKLDLKMFLTGVGTYHCDVTDLGSRRNNEAIVLMVLKLFNNFFYFPFKKK